MNEIDILASASRTLKTELHGLAALEKALNGDLAKPFQRAVTQISQITGRLIVTGMGKSGHIGSKMAATFASTGTPAFFVHPAEANHGDLGMIARDDAILAMSWSGEATELKGIVAYSRRFKIPLVALTSEAKSTLGRECDICLLLPKEEEACPLGLAPTTSTIMQMAVGDALAISLLEARGFSSSDFKTFHPGGQLGANLTQVSELMHADNAMPLVPAGSPMEVAVETISQKGFGCVGVVDENNNLVGIITDGDLRRQINLNFSELSVDSVMTPEPKTIAPTALASTAIAMLNEMKVTTLFVVENDKPVGLIHMHDLLRAGVV